MEYIEPNVEYWRNQNNINHIARCARICYASSNETNNENMVRNLIRNGHLSMLRHGTHYFKIPEDKKALVPNSEFVAVLHYSDLAYFVAANGQYIHEHPNLYNEIKKYECSSTVISESPAYKLVRLTFVIDCAISTSREYNRTSPNNIAEQSTRYVNFLTKKGFSGGIRICEPHWLKAAGKFDKFMANLFWRIDEYAYKFFLRRGLPPEDAREFLPLTCGTRVAYTYTVQEWLRILDLRLFGKTGKPHPNAKIIAEKLSVYINNYFE